MFKVISKNEEKFTDEAVLIPIYIGLLAPTSFVGAAIPVAILFYLKLFFSVNLKKSSTSNWKASLICCGNLLNPKLKALVKK